jgi:opacity protein-like surface antigen
MPLVIASGTTGPSSNTNSEVPKSSIQSKTGFYVTGAAGGNWPQNTNAYEITDFLGQDYGFVENHFSGISIETGLGYDFGGLRVEATYAYDSSSLAGYTDSVGTYNYSGGSVSKNSVFANAYWDINVQGRVKPYIGGGIGYSNLRVQDSSDGINDYSGYNAGGFGYQAKVGLRYVASRRTDVFAEAVYRGMAGYTATDEPFVYQYGNYNSWGFQLGSRIRF